MDSKQIENKVLTTEEKIELNIKKKKQKKMKKNIIVWSIVAVVLIGSTIVYSNYKSTGFFFWQDKEAIMLASMPIPEEETVQKLKYTKTVDLSGELEPYQTENVLSKSSGTIDSVLVENGDIVTKGQLLVTIDDTEVQYQISALEAEIKETKLQGTSSKLELLNMELASYQSKLDDTKLYAPIDGIVTDVNVAVGDYTSAQDDCVTIIDASKLMVEVDIDELDLKYITEDSVATITYESLPGVTSEAVISYMPYAGYLSDQGIGVKTVEFTINNPPEGIYPGFSFEGTIIGESEEEMLIVSEDAVKTKNNESYVMKQTSDGSEQVTVTTNYLSEGYVEILTGDITEGDILLVTKAATTTTEAQSENGLLSTSMMGVGAGGPPSGDGNARRPQN